MRWIPVALLVACSRPAPRAVVPTITVEENFEAHPPTSVEDQLCPSAGYVFRRADDVAVGDVDAAEDRLQAELGRTLYAEGVYLPPGESRSEWTFGVLARVPLAHRQRDDGWDFAVGFRCPATEQVARVFHVERSGAAYPDVSARADAWVASRRRGAGTARG